MILTDNEISDVCYSAYLRSKLKLNEKVGFIRGIPTIMKMSWYDRVKSRIVGEPRKWEGEKG